MRLSVPKNIFASSGVPINARRPFLPIKIILSHKSRLCVVWVTITIVFPCVFERRFKTRISFCSVPGSRPEVGSSKKNIPGSARSSTAILALFFCPPLKFFIMVFWCSVNSIRRSTSWIRSSISCMDVLSGIFIFAV